MTPDDKDWPRIHRITASCCGAEIIRFDLPSRAPVLLAQDGVRYGWRLTRAGTWRCKEHRGTYA